MTLKQIEEIAMRLDPIERKQLAGRLLESVEPPKHGELFKFTGRWAGKFPADVDVEADLKEIRSEWLKEWDAEEFKP